MVSSSLSRRHPLLLLPVLLIVLLLPSLAHSQQPCHFATDCPSSTTSLCLHNHCVSFMSQKTSAHFFDPVGPFFNLSSIISAVNSVPIPLGIRARMLRNIAHGLLSINPYTVLHRIVHGVDIQTRISQMIASISPKQTPYDFHVSLRAFFASLNDFHTLFQPPLPMRNTVATLGFVTMRVYNSSKSPPSFIVTQTIPTMIPSTLFRPGVELLSINKAPISILAANLGRAGFGANPSARLARGTITLSLRSLAFDEAPKKQTARIQYRTLRGNVRTVFLKWHYTPLTDPTLLNVLNKKLVVSDSDHTTLPTYSLSSHALSTASLTRQIKYIEVPSPFNALFSAHIRETSRGPIGVLRFPGFGAEASRALSQVLSAILLQLPPTGLVIDIRSNTGGLASPCRLITELVSSVQVPQSPSQLVVSPLGARIISEASSNSSNALNRALAPFKRPYRDAVRVKERFTPPVGNIYADVFSDDVTSTRATQVYFGKVVTLTDAQTFSAGEVFAALQVDTGASIVIGMDATTAGGGASTTSFFEMKKAFPKTLGGVTLEGIGFTTAVARFFRTGKNNSGAFIEAKGVTPNIRYFPTIADALFLDYDLFEFIARQFVPDSAS